jgi:hypothetical protein
MKSASLLFTFALALACAPTPAHTTGRFAPQPASRAFVSAEDLRQFPWWLERARGAVPAPSRVPQSGPGGYGAVRC